MLQKYLKKQLKFNQERLAKEKKKNIAKNGQIGDGHRVGSIVKSDNNKFKSVQKDQLLLVFLFICNKFIVI